VEWSLNVIEKLSPGTTAIASACLNSAAPVPGRSFRGIGEFAIDRLSCPWLMRVTAHRATTSSM
jgi:hypothetical protein